MHNPIKEFNVILDVLEPYYLQDLIDKYANTHSSYKVAFSVINLLYV